MATIFTDTFTSTVQQALETYDAGWVISTYVSGGSSGRNRVTTGGVCEPNQSGGLNAYYRTSAGNPTINMEIQASVSISGAASARFGGPIRTATGSVNYYCAQLIFDATSSWACRIARSTAGGSITVLGYTAGLGLSLGTFYDVRFRTTQGATSTSVTLTAQVVGQSTEVQVTDTSAGMISSGYPGLITWQSGGDISRLSSFQTDDLTSAATALGFITIVRE